VLVQHLVFDDSVDSIMVHTIIEKQEVIEKALDRRTETVQVIEQPQVPVVQCRQAAAQQVVQSEIPFDEEIPF
jgi:hypothetical protein